MFVVSPGGHVAEQVGNEAALDVADGEESVACARRAAHSCCEYRVISATEHAISLLVNRLLKRRNRGLAALRALLEVLGRLLVAPIIQIVNTVDEGLVALLEAHDERRRDLTLSNLKVRRETKEILTARVDPEVCQVKRVADIKFRNGQHGLEVDEPWHAENWRELE